MWPVNADGTKKTIGQMTNAERREIMAASAKRIEKPTAAVKAAVSRILNAA